MSHRNPYRNKLPMASQFEDGRMGIINRAVGAEIDWANTRATVSGSYLTRCVVIRTRADRYFAVGEETVVNLGELDLEVEKPDFTGTPNDEVPMRRYPDGSVPSLTIGGPWKPAVEMAEDSSAVDFSHIDWRRENKLYGSLAIVSFDMPNYFDLARQALSEFEPMATQLRTPIGPTIKGH